MTFFVKDYFQFFYGGANRLIYDRGNWTLATSEHSAMPLHDKAKVTEILTGLKEGRIISFGYTSESLEKALGMFNRTGF